MEQFCKKCKTNQEETNFLGKIGGGFPTWCKTCRTSLSLVGKIKTHVCSSCNIEKDITDFYLCERTKEGIYHQCKSCTKNKNKEPKTSNKLKQRRKDYYYNKGGYIKAKINKQHFKQDNVNKIIALLGDKCIVCNKQASYNIWCQFDLHHTDPTIKQFRISNLIKQKWTDRIEKEIVKCVLLCKCCHAQLHYEETLDTNI